MVNILDLTNNLRDRLNNTCLSKYSDQIISLSKPAIKLISREATEKDIKVGTSTLGGYPDLPKAFEWPVFSGDFLNFIAQINLAEISAFDINNLLPDSGMLYFFYDLKEFRWGFDPDDKGSWRIIYCNDTSTLMRFQHIPNSDFILDHCSVTFSTEFTLPDLENEDLKSLNFNEEEHDFYCNLIEHSKDPHHRLFGYPLPIQTSEKQMKLDCELSSSNIYVGDLKAYSDPRIPEFTQKSSDWQLLLQLDSDQNPNFMWGDCGLIYFWMKQSDLEQQNFHNAWLYQF